MISVSRRIASATLALTLTVVPTTALHALPADVEGATTSWTATVLDYVAGILEALRPRDELRSNAAVRERSELDETASGELAPGTTDARPWLDPNGESIDSLSRPEGEARPWLDPNG